MLWHSLSSEKIGIWGQGREGQSALRALQRHAPTAIPVLIDEASLERIASCAVIIKSPGVSLYRPEIKQALEKGIQITSGTNLFFANKNPRARTLAVTGTKGKSTTASLLAHTLAQLGKSVRLGGNIGTPLLDLLDAQADFVVAELSSYQCADFTGAPDIAVLLNLYPEHLHWHQTTEQYYQDKLRLIRRASQCVLNAQDDNTRRLWKTPPAGLFNTSAGIHIRNGVFYKQETPLFETSALPLRGEHNALNACAVLSALDLLGLDLLAAEAAFKTFQALPHRLEVIGSCRNLTYVDDSISTTPETAAAALKAFDSGQAITLIAGGFDRGQEHAALVALMARHSPLWRLIALPDTGKRLGAQAAAAGIQTTFVQDMAAAVRAAQEQTPAGGIVLLSPAAPSFTRYKNFEERGEDFKNCVLGAVGKLESGQQFR